MAKELLLTGAASGSTHYALIYNMTGDVYSSVGPAFVTLAQADLANYARALAETGTTGVFFSDFPAVAAGRYGVEYRLRAGGSPAWTDTVVRPLGSLDWHGTAVIGVANVPKVDLETIKTKEVSTGPSGIVFGDTVGTSNLNAAGVADSVWNAAMSSWVANGTFGKQINDLSAADFADAVWDEAAGAHNVGGSTGARLNGFNPADYADAVWDEPRTSHVVGGSFGEALQVEPRFAGSFAAVSSSGFTLPSNEGTTNYLGWGLFVYSGPGAGKSRTVTAYDTTSRVGSVDRAWGTPTPTTASVYVLTEPRALDGGGLDPVVVETGVNARQAFRALLAPVSGVETRPDSVTIAYAAAGNPGVPRVTATIDPDTGRRTAVTLTLGA